MTTSTQIKRGYVDTVDGQIHYLAAGEGYPVVFLHMTADSATQWELVLPLLAARGRRAIALDIPGHGNSYRPASQPDGPYYAAAVLEALRGLGIERCVLIGHHFGAIVGAWATTLHPERVAAFGAYGWPRHDDELRAKRRAMPERVFSRSGDLLKQKWEERFEINRLLLPPDEPDRYTEAMAIRATVSKMQAGKTWNWAYHCIGESDPVALAGQITCRVLLFAGPRDQNYQESKDAIGDFPDARFVEMDWVGVDAPEEDPEAFARIVDAFLSDPCGIARAQGA